MVTEDKCSSTVLRSLSPKFGMRSGVHCWIANLKFALSEGWSWKIKFTFKVSNASHTSGIFAATKSACIFFYKVLDASTVPLMFIKKAATWICMAEKSFPAVGPAHSGPLEYLVLRNTRENWIDSYPHISLVLRGGKAAGAKYWTFMVPWSLTSYCVFI